MPVRRRTNRGKKNKSSIIKLEDESVISQGGDSDLDRIIMWLEDFDMQFATRVAEFDDLLIRKFEEQKRIYSIQRLKIPSDILNNVLKQKGHSGKSKVVAETPINDKTSTTSIVPRSRTRKRSASVTTTLERENFHKTRSSSLNTRVQRTVNKQELKTPAPGSFFQNTPSVITPKMALNAPLSVVRYPHQGELFAFSNTGSPMVVSSDSNARIASLKVPLTDGHVVSILPQPNSKMIDTLSIDHETKEQLKNLVYNINALIKEPQ